MAREQDMSDCGLCLVEGGHVDVGIENFGRRSIDRIIHLAGNH